jgi:SAM-dependent methyltransferase
MNTIGRFIAETFSLPAAGELTKRLALEHGCRTALDVGCGTGSHLSALRPGMKTVGVDSSPEFLEIARKNSVHDQYICADLLEQDLTTLLPPEFEGKVDLVSLYGVIEHLPKAKGHALLEACERLTRKIVVLETPNGFLAQGPEFGNENMRHLSGWFIHDFHGLGYEVIGTTGTRYLRGYGAGLKLPYKGLGSVDVVLARLLLADRFPRHSFNLFAYKDVRGVPARMGSSTLDLAPTPSWREPIARDTKR